MASPVIQDVNPAPMGSKKMHDAIKMHKDQNVKWTVPTSGGIHAVKNWVSFETKGTSYPVLEQSS